MRAACDAVQRLRVSRRKYSLWLDYSLEGIVGKLRGTEDKPSGAAEVSQMARELRAGEASFHPWRKRYGGTDVPCPQKEARRMEES